MMRIFTAAALVSMVLMSWSGGQAGAQGADGSHDFWTQCLSSTNPDVIISSCTRVIVPPVDPLGDIAIALGRRGSAYHIKGQYDLAMADFSQAIVYRPNYAVVWSNRGSLYAERGEYDLAVADFSQALSLKPSYVAGRITPEPIDSAAVYRNRGSAYAGMEQYDRAMMDFGQAIRLRPNDSEAYSRRGNVYNSEGDSKRAIEDYDKAIQLNGRDADALYGRGIVEHNLGDSAGYARDIAAAREIDPGIADRILKGSDTADAKQAQAGMLAGSGSGAIAHGCEASTGKFEDASEQPNAAAVSYVDASLEQLKKAVPALRGIIDADNSRLSETGSAASAELEEVLDKTSSNVATTLHRMPNLVAKEEVVQETPSDRIISETPGGQPRPQYGYTGGPDNPLLPPAIGHKSQVYSYRIIPRPDSGQGVAMDEYRMDKANHAVDETAANPNRPRSLGFSTTWLYFLPENLKQSHFRYLGQEKIDGRLTDVVAFAEIAGQSHLGTMIDAGGLHCTAFTQGIVWIDPVTFQFVRVQTDLLSPLPGIPMNELRAVVNYSEVKIPQRNLSLWLPKDVETEWQTRGPAETELHRYSGYKLFGATVKMVVPSGDSL